MFDELDDEELDIFEDTKEADEDQEDESPSKKKRTVGEVSICQVLLLG